jgi:hypothetical protein
MTEELKSASICATVQSTERNWSLLDVNGSSIVQRHARLLVQTFVDDSIA